MKNQESVKVVNLEDYIVNSYFLKEKDICGFTVDVESEDLNTHQMNFYRVKVDLTNPSFVIKRKKRTNYYNVNNKIKCLPLDEKDMDLHSFIQLISVPQNEHIWNFIFNSMGAYMDSSLRTRYTGEYLDYIAKNPNTLTIIDFLLSLPVSNEWLAVDKDYKHGYFDRILTDWKNRQDEEDFDPTRRVNINELLDISDKDLKKIIGITSGSFDGFENQQKLIDKFGAFIYGEYFLYDTILATSGGELTEYAKTFLVFFEDEYNQEIVFPESCSISNLYFQSSSLFEFFVTKYDLKNDEELRKRKLLRFFIYYFIHHLDIDEELNDAYYGFLYNRRKVERLLIKNKRNIPDYVNEEYPADILVASGKVKELKLKLEGDILDE